MQCAEEPISRRHPQLTRAFAQELVVSDLDWHA